MKKLLIALDMDGTLLNEHQEICPNTKKYLQKLAKMGHIIVIASGRPIRSIIKYYNELGLHSPIVCYNGANVISPYDPNFKEECFAFPKDVIKEIYNKLGSKHIENIMCETNDKIWALKDDEVLYNFFCPDNMQVVLGDFNETLNANPMTMIIKSADEKYNSKIQETINNYPSLKLRFWNGNFHRYSEIYFESVSKANGLKYIADYYHIPMKNIIAFGDASNDIEMFQCAGVSVAMQNADNLTKSRASMVAKYDNNNDGIMYALKDILKRIKQTA